jgi:hypothetical protein
MGLFFESKGMSRIVKHLEERNVGLITAFVPYASGKKNKERNKVLSNFLLKSPYGFMHVRGRWFKALGEDIEEAVGRWEVDEGYEDSYFVIGGGNRGDDNFKSFLVDLCAVCEQDAVFLSTLEKDGKRLNAYYDAYGKLDKRLGSFKLTDPEKCIEDYFKRLVELAEQGGGKVKPSGYSMYKRFTFVFEEVVDERGLMKSDGPSIKSMAILGWRADRMRE